MAVLNFPMPALDIFRVTETENASDPSFDDDDWGSQRAYDAEQAAERFAEALNRDPDAEGGDDRTFDVSVRSGDGSVARFIVRASLEWSYSTTEKGDAM
jgi:hypothetical protein